MLNKVNAALLLLLSPVAAFSHEGHGLFHGTEIAHYLTSFSHAVPIFAILGLSVWYILSRRKNRKSYSHKMMDHA